MCGTQIQDTLLTLRVITLSVDCKYLALKHKMKEEETSDQKLVTENDLNCIDRVVWNKIYEKAYNKFNTSKAILALLAGPKFTPIRLQAPHTDA